ncbi:hypothetical protein KC332_g8502 [Hortaea werneckii]|uniref:Uncharacterized protein n=1 Tax=Hortaea werneckii TaxID=91943 RepID=A0A3M7HX06_HORWE|nr:hypothetical protein KC358_g7092 [Hortaea werneckii]KAI6834295.1 hypothetical protein KC350_g6743 [Hortaea werneckii]KAI6930529.1 hypothetical protein KC348_g7546 [Hortaea werneckii]KAI6938997.1 hypothetical protein KC341_g4502 [Hortaea werneckii]KAI6960985.1 hypothetical protein KC329_g16857 [Hortaea werneckii]
MVDTQTQTEKKQVEEFVSSDDNTEDANNLTQGKTSKNPSDSDQQVTGREGKGVMTGGVEKLGVGKDWGAGNEADTEPMKGGHPTT